MKKAMPTIERDRLPWEKGGRRNQVIAAQSLITLARQKIKFAPRAYGR